MQMDGVKQGHVLCHIIEESQVLLQCGAACNDITNSNVMIAAEHKSDFALTKGTPYLALTGELWGVCCEDMGKN